MNVKFDVTGQVRPKRTEPRRIAKSKKMGILNVFRVAPAVKKLFCLDIPERDVGDLASSIDYNNQ